MKTDRETKERLLASAKSEFLEKGYVKASLRKICANADVTTGALYFFFQDKENLFSCIVDKPYRELTEMLKNHFAEDSEMMSEANAVVLADRGHEELVQKLIYHLYSNRDAFLLLLTKSQGTGYENCVDDIVEMTEQFYYVMALNMAKQTSDMRVSSYMIHWLSHMNVDAFIHLLTHETDEQKALHNMKLIMNNFVKGWMELILISEDEDKKEKQG